MTPRPLPERLPMLPRAQMTEAQRTAADELIAGPRGAVAGPFIALLRSPALLAHVQKLGAFLRFGTTLPPRLSEFATLVVARQWTQQFEWAVHAPLALQAGTAPETLDALRQGRRPGAMSDDEALVYDLATELAVHKGWSDASYAAALARFGEAGVVELTALLGYFAMVSMVLNVAHTPPQESAGGGAEAVPPLPVLPR